MRNKTQQLNIKPSIQKVLGVLSVRNADMLASRYGIALSSASKSTGSRETLEGIGKRYGITRERVRQIEEASYIKIRNADQFELLHPPVNAVVNFLRSQGGIATEQQLMGTLVPVSQRPHLALLLSLSKRFDKIKEGDVHNSSWAVDADHAEAAQRVLQDVEKHIRRKKQPLNDNELIELTLRVNQERLPLTRETVAPLLSVSKIIKQGPFGQWGLAHWPEVSPRGVRDKAYLVFDREGRPLHFRDIARLIDEASFVSNSKKNTHPQTVHNELIKDGRFVLVGRGIYALAKWGYTPGTVKDVIVEVLAKEGQALQKEEIISKVLEQRMVQKNTILLNLQNKNYFIKTEGGKYSLVA